MTLHLPPPYTLDFETRAAPAPPPRSVTPIKSAYDIREWLAVPRLIFAPARGDAGGKWLAAGGRRDMQKGHRDFPHAQAMSLLNKRKTSPALHILLAIAVIADIACFIYF